jgi:hypothetical protein
MEIDDAWHLAEILKHNGEKILPINFVNGGAFLQSDTTPLQVVMNVAGNPVDYRHTAFNIPIVHHRVNEVITKWDETAIQRIPVIVGAKITGYEILNITRLSACLDFTRADYVTYPDDYEDEPEKSGKVRWIANVVIEPDKVKGQHIFRLEEWPVIIIVSQPLRAELERNGFTGLRFKSI